MPESFFLQGLKVFPSPNLFGDLLPHQKELSICGILECLVFSSPADENKGPDNPTSQFLPRIKTQSCSGTGKAG